MSNAVEPFSLAVPQRQLDDLRRRLEATRWPERETVDDWSQGVPLERAQALVEYWRTRYDWRRCEAMLNRFGQYRTRLDGLAIHFLHVRSRHEDALPLLITHGWPGSVIEFHKIIGPLTDPTAHGGEAADAFHVVAPSLPGYGFSEKPQQAGWNLDRITRAWAQLMPRLGYARYVAQGGDWGALVTTRLGSLRPSELAGIHLNMQFVIPQPPYENLSAEEQATLDQMARFASKETGYSKLQATRPQTLGYALLDSPAGQAMWIYEKLKVWTDCDGDPQNVLTLDEILDNVMLYWLPGTGVSSARLYWETFDIVSAQRRVDIPVGCSLFPKELFRAPRSWADRFYSEIIHWNELDKGGHFAAFEQPQRFVQELRACFRRLR